MSLIVCNLLVLVTLIYRVTRNGRDLTADHAENVKHAGSSNRLTTVDLDWAGSSYFASMAVGGETGCTGTGLTDATDVSSFVLASMSGGDATFDSVIATGGPGSIPADAGTPLALMATKQ